MEKPRRSSQPPDRQSARTAPPAAVAENGIKRKRPSCRKAASRFIASLKGVRNMRWTEQSPPSPSR
jgi:hypothetical protein